MLTQSELTQVVTDVLSHTLGRWGFETASVHREVDPDGVDALLVTARFRDGSEPADGKASMAALTELQKALRGKGDDRFAYLRYDYAGDAAPFADEQDFVP